MKKETSPFPITIVLMFAGMFFGMFTFAFIGMATVVSKIFLSKVLAFFCFAGLLLPLRFYKKWFGMSKVESVLFNIMAVGPTISALLLWSNFLIRMSEQEETYNIVSANISSAEHFDNINVIYTLENNTYADYPEFRTHPLEKEDLPYAKNVQKLKIKIADGLLGYKVFLGNEVSEDSSTEK